ncbi:GntR family transcriptional regulator [Shinella kummerowiae]|uniref:GntR family transcriptional regulator n=1 Tax=Shinella kummerowiae TaxID=417745 RepID=UPI0021B4E85B|nr:GntR family transcriptional regulator [Shinella kummerowiae]MCT7664127.1 GntR family transcriptional regulator [Shinella kummerowiae]
MSDTLHQIDESTPEILDPPAEERASATLHDEILSRLRDFIVEGNLEDGARIPERHLCDLFGISRTPLREALKVLAAEGVIDLLPNRGARVKPLSPKDILDLFDLMGGLESLAGRLACEHITDAEVEEVEALHHKMYTFYLRRDRHEYFKYNQLIHEKILSAARNEALSSTYRTVAGRIRRVRYAANLDDPNDRWSEAVREHETILDALRRRAGVELSNILFEHLRNKRAAVMRHFSHPETDQKA